MTTPQNTDHICQRSFISGRVQGVYFRHFTREKALDLGLTGWVRNLADGRVEAVVEGDRLQVEAILNWFWQGSPASQVKSIETEVLSLQAFRGFEIRH